MKRQGILSLLGGSALCSVLGLMLPLGGAETSGPQASSDFSRSTIDIGVVVKDLEASVKFYVEALGFQEVPGFSVPGEFCKTAALTDGHPLTVRVLTLGEGAEATRLKLMSLPAAKPAPVDSAFVHGRLGFSYITVHVNNASKAVARLEKAGGKLASQGMVPLSAAGNVLCVLHDPDGNIVELVGPRG